MDEWVNSVSTERKEEKENDSQPKIDAYIAHTALSMSSMRIQ